MDRRVVVIAVAGLALLGASCAEGTGPAAGGSRGVTSVTPQPGTPIPSSGEPASPSASSPEVPEVLDFEAPLLGGGTFRGANLAGKDVAFWFWAPW